MKCVSNPSGKPYVFSLAWVIFIQIYFLLQFKFGPPCSYTEDESSNWHTVILDFVCSQYTLK